MEYHLDTESVRLSYGCSLTIRLNLPKLSVGESILHTETSTGLEASRTEEGTNITMRWLAQGRAYCGQLLLKTRGRGICWQLRVAPEDGQAWKLSRTSEGSGEVTGWTNLTQGTLFHADNTRGVTQDAPLMEGTYWVPLSEWRRPLNAGRWQSFPGVWVKEQDLSSGFVCGALTQNIWKFTLIGEASSPGTLSFQGNLTPPGIAARSFAAGESYIGETLYFECVEAETPRQAFAGYLAALSDGLQPCKSQSPLERGVSWGSWNDRQPNFWDVSEPLLERTSLMLKNLFPTVRAMQVDDGYADGGLYEIVADRWAKLEHGLDPDIEQTIRRARRLGAAFLHEPGHAIAADRFPNGMRAARERMSQAGYITAIWLGLNLVADAALAQDHPEWMTMAEHAPGNDPELCAVFGDQGGFRVLDPSRPEVRRYLESIASVMFREWGFGSLKLDFWSYAFESDSFRLQCDERTAFEWRTWFFSMFASYLAEDSFFTIGCDISTGNPFLCPWVDNVRYGIDIGNGRWESIKYSALTGTFLLHVEMYRFYILNSDSIGILRKLPRNEQRVFLAWCAATRSSCEIGGDLALQPREQLRELQKLLLAPKNGSPAYPGETQHLHTNEPTAIIWTRGDMFSLAGCPTYLPELVLAVFNWADEKRTISVNLEEMASAAARVADVDFFEENWELRDGTRWEVTLPPRSVRLSHVSPLSNAQPRILDSSWQIQSLSEEDGSLELRLLGDSPVGFLIYWPEAAALIMDTSLPAVATPQAEHIFRITPELQEDALHEWRVRLSASREVGKNISSHRGHMTSSV